MSEAIIARGGKGSINSGSSNQLVTNIITNTTLFVVSDNVKDNKLYVRIFGAGGGGSMFGGGGGGWMNNGEITVSPKESIQVTIGVGGVYDGGGGSTGAGGTSSFGTYLAAAGGSRGDRNEPGIGGNSGLDNRYDKFGGILYYSDSNHMRLSTTGSANSVRLYYGDGGSWDRMSPSGDSGSGNSGCVIIHYIN